MSGRSVFVTGLHLHRDFFIRRDTALVIEWIANERRCNQCESFFKWVSNEYFLFSICYRAHSWPCILLSSGYSKAMSQSCVWSIRSPHTKTKHVSNCIQSMLTNLSGWDYTSEDVVRRLSCTTAQLANTCCEFTPPFMENLWINDGISFTAVSQTRLAVLIQYYS